MPRRLTRRDANWLITRVLGTAAAQPFVSSWLRAAESTAHAYAHQSGSTAPPEPDRWTNYKPAFFSPQQFKMLDAFSAILIPSDETPGAREAHVTCFIDFVVNAAAEYAPEIQTEWRTAMEWLGSNGFDKMTPEMKLHFIQEISAPERDRAQKHAGFQAYRLIKDMTVRAFYTSRVGLIDVLEYKGNAYLAEFPGCNHPEHRTI